MFSSPAPWVVVAGGLHRRGGMDRANAALVDYLLAGGHQVHAVVHVAAPEYHGRDGLELDVVPRPFGSIAAGELSLEVRGRRMMMRVGRDRPDARFLANGANCRSGDLNWVHSVHHAWPCRDVAAPGWFRAKNRVVKAWARRRERAVITHARTVIVNSDRTRRDVMGQLGIDGARVHTVYLGSAADWLPATSSSREAMRRKWCRDPGQPLVAFVGALGHDTNKGIDRLLEAWRRLDAGGWRAQLIVAGPGETLRWERNAPRTGDRVRFVGYVETVGEILAAADLLVSPVWYEAYGLAVHEALCRDVPVLVSETAGIVERMGADAPDFLLREGADPDAIASRLLTWAAASDRWRQRAAAIGARLRSYTEHDMAARIVSIARAAE